jgi:hypothetical protein
MMTALQAVGAVAILAAAGAYAYWTFRPSRQYVLNREPGETGWGSLHADDDLGLANEALAAITSAFLLRTADVARLRPDDRLMDICRAAYPMRDTPDALEFEALWKEMKARLALSDAELGQLTQLTVGEVVRVWVNERGGRRTRR